MHKLLAAFNAGMVPLRLILLVAALAVIVVTSTTLSAIVRRPDAALAKSDFAAFYCGAAVARAHEDPYALSPLRTCEATQTGLASAPRAESGINPDPLPGYVMAFFAPLTVLPYREAALVWDALLIGAIAATAAILADLTALPLVVVGAILVFADGALIIPNGQLAPVLLLGLALAAYGLVRERALPVFIGATLAMIEPHIGLPAFGAIFIWRPALRLGLLLCAAILAVLSIVMLGVPVDLEYVRAALPTQAQAEATTSIQYSFAWLLHYFGVADTQAIRIATVQYAVFACASIALAGRVRRKLDSPAAIAFFPPVIALFGGPYLHLSQMAAAIPFALLLATRLRGPARGATWVAIALLAVPWASGSRLVMLEGTIIVLTVVLTCLRHRRAAIVASVAVVSVLVYAAISGPVMTQLVPALPQHALAQTPPLPRALDGDRLAADEDARESRRDKSFAISTPRTLAQKLPIWFALSALVVVSFATARKQTAKRNDSSQQAPEFASFPFDASVSQPGTVDVRERSAAS